MNVCVACHREDPPGGCRLTEDFDWVCRQRVACAQEIARQIREGEREGSLPLVGGSRRPDDLGGRADPARRQVEMDSEGDVAGLAGEPSVEEGGA